MGGWLPPETPPSHGGTVLVLMRRFPGGPACLDLAIWTWEQGWCLTGGRSETIYPLCWIDLPALPAAEARVAMETGL